MSPVFGLVFCSSCRRRNGGVYFQGEERRLRRVIKNQPHDQKHVKLQRQNSRRRIADIANFHQIHRFAFNPSPFPVIITLSPGNSASCLVFTRLPLPGRDRSILPRIRSRPRHFCSVFIYFLPSADTDHDAGAAILVAWVPMLLRLRKNRTPLPSP